MALVLAGAAGAGGALAGFVLGVAAAALPNPASVRAGVAAAVVVVVAGTAASLDLWGGAPPPSVRRQVPRTWARAFALPVAAVLYGARLGVGPLTVLNTWLWWAAAVLGAWAGPWWSTAVGALFGTVRIAVLVPLGAGVSTGGAMASRMTTVRAGERMTRRVTVAAAWVVAVAALLVLGACTNGDADDAAKRAREARRAPTSTTTSSAPESGPADAAAAAAASALLPDDVGAGYRRLADDARPGLGALDLEAAARAEADTSAERSVLATRRFRHGVARAWKADDGSEVYLAVYEFADAKGATAYLADGLVTLEGRAAEQYPVDGLDGATGFSQAERRPGGALTTHGLVFARGARFFLVLTASARPGSTPAAAAALAHDIAARQAAASASG